MLMLSENEPIDPATTQAARRRDEEGGGGFWLAVALMMPVLTGFIGYAIGFERATKKD